jgi:ATP synthase protein I
MAVDEPREESGLPEDARLTSLDRRLKEAQAEEARRAGGHQATADYYKSPGYRVLSVLIGYPLGSALIGFGIDWVAGTRGVWVIMLFVGFAIAMWEVWKISKQSSSAG